MQTRVSKLTTLQTTLIILGLRDLQFRGYLTLFGGGFLSHSLSGRGPSGRTRSHYGTTGVFRERCHDIDKYTDKG